jgi:lysophospholipase L1-like esterase
VALVTIDIGANDLARIDENGDVVSCLFEFAGCVAQQASMEANLSAVLAALRTAAGPDVPIVGMTYYNVYLPLDDPVVDARVSSTNALLASTYAAAGVAVADVAGAFPTTDDVCSFTWFCTDLDVHPNAAGYGVIADEFLKVLP